MQILIEPIAGGFRARPWNDTADGATPEEAVERLTQLAEQRRAAGALVELAPPDKNAPNPWLAIAGIFEDDDDFDEWQAEIQKYRRERDAEDALL